MRKPLRGFSVSSRTPATVLAMAADKTTRRGYLITRRYHPTDNQDKMKHWRPRWSVRILLIVITLICAYLACWGPTKKQGPQHVLDLGATPVMTATAFAPLLVAAAEPGTSGYSSHTHHCYYFWFFGYVAKLPYEREIPSRYDHDHDHGDHDH